MQATFNAEAKLDLILRPASAEGGYDGCGRPALIQLAGGKVRELSHRDLEELIGKAETLLTSLGVKAGDKVIMTSPNSPELAACILATWRLGAMAVPIDFRLTEKELANVAVSAPIAAKAVLVFAPLIKDYAALEAALSAGGKQTVLCDLNELNKQKETRREGGKATDFKNLKEPAILILTSGTTGTPKGALHDIESLLHNLLELGEMADFTKELKALLPVPISHVLGLEVLLIGLLSGSTIIFSEMTVEGIIAANNQFKPEFLVGVPTIYGAFVALPPGTINLENSRVLLCGGAPLPISLAEEFHKVFGRRLNNGYGSTESKIIAVNLEGPDQSVGKLVPSVTVKIIGGDGKELPEGESGEIIICGETLMLGYIGQEEATKKVIYDGGYHTGDIGYVKDGYLYISGRAKELIIVAGNKVFPVEVEDVLRAQDLVKEVAVIGVPHSKLGQIVKAHIVLEPSEQSEALDKASESGDDEAKKTARQALIQTMRDYCAQHLKRELRPMEWEFYSSTHPLPRTSAGKIDKKQLS